MEKQIYRLIIVDDEVEIAQRIASRITDDSGFKVVGIAHNGSDTIDLLEKIEADALLTDIHMPYINGIELSRYVRNEYPKMKIAFISGYDEFEYAKEAIKLDVLHYLLKPIDDDEFYTFLEKLKHRLDEEHQALFNQEQLDQMFMDNQQVMIENHFNSLLHMYRIQEFDLQKFHIFGIDLSYGHFMTGIIRIDSIADFYEVEYLRIFLVNLIKKKFSEEYKVYTFNSVLGIVFILHSSTQNFDDVENKMNEIIQTKSDYSDIHIQVAISNCFDSFTLFSQSILQAKEALSFSPYLNVGTLIFYKDILSKEKKQLNMSHQDIESIQSIIKYGSEDEIHKLFKDLIESSKLDNEMIYNSSNHLVSLAHIVLDYANSLNIDFNQVTSESIIDKLKELKTLSEVYIYLQKLILKIRDLYQNESQSSSNDIFNEAYAFLENNFQDPSLGMELASEKLGISISYLSILFKKNCDSSFNKELIKIRMEKAKELLKFSQKKIYEVAEEVGYSDVYYFSYSFKKYTHKSPKEFRSET